MNIEIFNMTKPQRVYLDTNLLMDFFRRIIRHRKDIPEIIEFLEERKETEKYISVFTIAEITANLMNEFKDRNLKKEYIIGLVNTLKSTIQLNIIEHEVIELSSIMIDYAYECRDAKDSIHVLIAKKNDLWFITRDNDVPRLKPLYEKIMGERKFRKQFD